MKRKHRLAWKFFRKIALNQILVVGSMLVACALIIRSQIIEQLIAEKRVNFISQLESSLKNIRQKKINPMEWCLSLTGGEAKHYSIIDQRGKVLCDNRASAESLENHLKYAEVAEAFKSGQGLAIRQSEGKNNDLFGYATIRTTVFLNEIEQKLVVRQSFPLSDLAKIKFKINTYIFVITLLFLVITATVALFSSLQIYSPLQSVIKKINEIKKMAKNQETLSHLDAEFEWMAIEKVLEQTQEGLKKYINELYKENEKISTVMESISEAILAIGINENILFANQQFKKKFLNKETRREDLSKFKHGRSPAI